MTVRETRPSHARLNATHEPRYVLIALGSHGRGDDGVGLHVAEQLTGRLEHCQIVSGQDDCMAILNAWEGAQLAIVVDAAVSKNKPGTIHRLELDVQLLPRELARCSSHGTGLAEAVELGRILKRMPAHLVVFAIEALSFSPGDDMTPAVRAAACDVADRVVNELAMGRNRWDISCG